MGAQSTILSLLLLFAIVPGCAARTGKQAAASHEPRAVAGVLPASKKDCTACHASGDASKGDAKLKKPVSALCLECHPDRKSSVEHKVDIVPAMEVKQLPLTEGKMTCVTCHDPHRNPYGMLLRAPKIDLCLRCHPY